MNLTRMEKDLLILALSEYSQHLDRKAFEDFKTFCQANRYALDRAIVRSYNWLYRPQEQIVNHQILPLLTQLLED